MVIFLFFKQKTAYEMRISDWSSDVCSSDLKALPEDAKQKIYYFFMQYGRFGDPEKVQRERKILAEMSDGWGPFLASSNAQLLDVRQIEIGRASCRERVCQYV